MPLYSHFAPTVHRGGYLPQYLHSVSHVVSKTRSPLIQDKALGTNDLGTHMLFFIRGRSRNVHPLFYAPMLLTGTDVRGKAGDTLVQSFLMGKH